MGLAAYWWVVCVGTQPVPFLFQQAGDRIFVLGRRNCMSRRDSQGYIIVAESSEDTLSIPTPGSPSSNSLASFTVTTGSRTNTSGYVWPAELQNSLADFYESLVQATTTLLPPRVASFARKYLLYPFLSGLIAATTEFLRRRYLRRL